MKSFLSKYFNFVFKKNITRLLATFIRIPLEELSILIGLSKKKVFLLLSKMILIGKLKGLLDFQTDSFINFKKINNFSFLSDFLKISIQLDQLVLKIFQK
mmetsp:Transcript_21603/g.41999  ORF Transcript_21603/g.41999 Transcript_21603/m.41999 type:complete len:100 (-) Transcript_21603:55-354(-)